MHSSMSRNNTNHWVEPITLSACAVLLSAIAACSPKNAEPGEVTLTSNPTRAIPQVPGGGERARTSPSGAKSADPFDGCDTCHVDVADQLAGTRHLAKRISCVKCHGPSRGHAKDENNAVKPDRVFARDDIDAFCGTCHKCSRSRRDRQLTGTNSRRFVCSDCHGSHKINRAGKPATQSYPSEVIGRG